MSDPDDIRTIEVDWRCPDMVCDMLEGIADQVAKEQYFNALHRLAELQKDLLHRFQELLRVK